MNEMEIFMYVMYALVMIEGLFLMLIVIRVPVIPFLWAQFKGMPLICMLASDGIGVWRVPKRLERDRIILKIGKEEFAYFINRAATIPIGFNRIGIGMEEKAFVFHPVLFEAVKELKEAGFGSYTEVDIAKYVNELAREVDDGEIKLDDEFDIFNEKTQRTERISAVEFVKRELTSRGFNKWVNPDRPVKDVLRGQKYKLIPSISESIENVQRFQKHSAGVVSLAEALSEERFKERQIANFGKGGMDWVKTATAIGFIIMMFTVAVILMYSSDVNIMELIGLDNPGGEPKKTTPKAPTTTLKAGPTSIK